MNTTTAPAMLKPRLSIMMFLQYAIWGAWLPILWPFLSGYRQLDAGQTANIFAVSAIGALLAPFVAGQIADRYFATQKFLGVSHLIGAAMVYQLGSISSYYGIMGFSLVYSIVYSPTLSLTNSLAFHHLTDRDKDFGKVRVWGTIGWIAAGIFMGHWLLNHHTLNDADAVKRVVATEFAPAEKRAELIAKKTYVAFAAPAATGENATQTEVKASPENEAKILAALESLNKSSDEAAVNKVAGELQASKALHADKVTEAVTNEQNKGRADAFVLSAILGVVMGVFCFTLPNTPPQKGKLEFAVVEAMKEIRRNPLVTLFLLAVPVSCIHQFYFVHTSQFLSTIEVGTAGKEMADSMNAIFGVGGGGLMTIGQMMELLVLAAMPLLTKKFPRKVFLAVGLAAYAIRMLVFAYAPGNLEGTALLGALVVGLSMHGFCFGCFIFVAYMVVDEQTSKDVRATAQTLFNFVIIGVGIIVGSIVAGQVAEWATVDKKIDYQKLFSVPMWAAIACLVLLLFFYPSKSRKPSDAEIETALQD